jgi:cell division protease FtsH
MNNTNEKKNKPRDIGIYIVILVILLATVFLLMSQKDTQSLKYSDIRSLFEGEKVKEFVVEGDTLILSLHEPFNGSYSATYKLYSFSVFYEDLHELIDKQYSDNIIEDYDYDVGFEAPWWLSFVPYLVLIGISVVLWYFMMNKSAERRQGSNALWQGAHAHWYRR